MPDPVFHHDVFVSYAHSDDEVPLDFKTGWVTTFVDELRKILRRRIGGAGADIWTDHQLASNDIVTDVLRDRVRRSRTLVLFLSNGYLASEWCQRELDDFLRLNASHKNRESVFVVELDRIDRERWPERLRELTPLCLYESDQLNKTRTSLVGYPKPPGDSRSAYWTQMNELAHLITEHLARLVPAPARDPLAVPATALPASPRTGTGDAAGAHAPRAVWIARPPDSLADAWEALAAALRQQGAIVSPPGWTSYTTGDATAFRAAVEADVAKAGLLVQLLAAEPGPVLANSAEDSCAVQAMLARLSLLNRPESKLAQWRSPAIDLSGLPDSPHRRLLQGTISCGFESFRQSVLYEYLAMSRPLSAKPIQLPRKGRALQLCVTAGALDASTCTQICEIVDHLGHSALPASASPTPGQSPADYRSQFEELLSEVDGVILVHGAMAPTWVQSRYAQLRKLSGGRRPWGALLEAPEAGKTPLLYGVDFERLDCRQGIQRPPIESFIQNLQHELHRA